MSMDLTDIQARILETKRVRLDHLPTRPLEEPRDEGLEARKGKSHHQLRAAMARPVSLNRDF
jgi:hypothetical protein